MIYESAIEQAKGIKIKLPDLVRLAKVTSLSHGRAYVQFYGEDSPSAKLYPYIEGYKPEVNDDVLMIVQAETFVIAGKISKSNIENNYYLLKADADDLYLTEEAADDKYALKGDMSEIKNNSYGMGFSSTSSADVVPKRYGSASGTTSLGTANSKFDNGFFTTLGGNSSSNAIQTAYLRNVYLYGSVYGNITPDADRSRNIGTSSYRYTGIHAYQITAYKSNSSSADGSVTCDTLVADKWKVSNGANSCSITGSALGTFTPSSSIKWGTSSSKFKEGYFTDLYADTLSVTTLSATTLSATTFNPTTLGNESASGAVQTLNVKDVKLYGDIIPNSTGVRTLGSANLKFKNGYFSALTVDNFSPTNLGANTASTAIQNAYIKALKMFGDITPDSSNTRSLGTNSAYLS